MRTIKIILNSFIFTLILLISLQTYSQDIIVMRNGDELEVKIKEILINEIKYISSTYTDGPVYTIPKSDVFMIKYPNGNKELIFQSFTKHEKNLSSFYLGKQDAKILYNDNKPLWESLIVTSIFSPAGIINGVIVSTIPAKLDNIEGIDLAKMNDIYYKNGFKKKAQAKKIKKVAIGFGLGIPINIVVFILIQSIRH